MMNTNRRNRELLRLVLDAMFIALYVVLSFFASIRIPPLIKISWASLPLLLAAFLFRPADAIAVALCGSFLEQMLSYGITPTTPLWMAPPVLHALFVSLLAPFCRKGRQRVRQTVLIASSEIFLTLINTAALYLDARIVGYPVGALAVVLPTRLLNGGIRAVLSALLVPALLLPLSKIVSGGRKQKKVSAPFGEEEAIGYIHSHHSAESVPGLSRIRELLEKLGNPQDGMRFVHIAGTNGKGSVSAMTEAVLRACGYRTGLFVSPYIKYFTERIQYCGEPIPPQALADLTERVRPVADGMKDPPTEFELVTAIGLLYFQQQNCDVVVLEVGMGGRLDSTNIIKDPLLTVITGISMDHTAILGDTVEKIAAEKAGIIKSHVPVIWGGEDVAARGVIESVAKEKDAAFVAVSDTPLTYAESSLSGTTISRGEWKDVHIPLLGTYQVKNLATVLEIVTRLREAGLDLPERRVREGLSAVRWPGRFEKLREDPLAIFDGAHNPEGIGAAVESIRACFGGRKVLIVTGMLADKAHGEMVRLLAPVAEEVFTLTPENPRALPAADLAAEFQAQGVCATAFGSIPAGVCAGLSRARETGLPLVVLGSLYLYSDVSNAVKLSV